MRRAAMVRFAENLEEGNVKPVFHWHGNAKKKPFVPELYWDTLMVLSAGWQYDQGMPCGPAANAAKYLAAEAGFHACEQAVMTHGGFGYAKEYHVERYLRESLIPRIAPISPQLILSFIAEKVLGLPKSY